MLIKSVLISGKLRRIEMRWSTSFKKLLSVMISPYFLSSSKNKRTQLADLTPTMMSLPDTLLISKICSNSWLKFRKEFNRIWIMIFRGSPKDTSFSSVVDIEASQQGLRRNVFLDSWGNLASFQCWRIYLGLTNQNKLNSLRLPLKNLHP